MKKKLNLTVVMRSHDCWGGYPLNLAACCRWLCEEAERLGMAVGTLTCISMSAHVYGRDWDAARSAIKKHGGAKWQQDPRSAWRVWREAVVKPHTMAFLPQTFDEDTGDPDTPLAGCTVCGKYRVGPATDVDKIQARMDKVFARAQAAGHEAYDGYAFCGGVEYVYHAEATDPEGTRVLVKLSAPTRERLVRDVQATGLVTDARHALWLGAEIGRL